MVIWSGFGVYWLFVQVILSYLSMAVMVNGFSKLLGAKFSILSALLVGAGVAYYVMGFLLDRFADRGRLILDPRTGQETVLKRRDSVFFIDCRIWQIFVPSVLVLLTLVGVFIP
jgi:hypothetical protein